MNPDDPPFGRYRLHVSAELRAFAERRFVEPRPPHERAEARREALSELENAELLLERDGTLVSRAGSAEFARVKLAPDVLARREFTFEKAPGESVRVERVSAGTLVVEQPGKPLLEFRRVSP